MKRLLALSVSACLFVAGCAKLSGTLPVANPSDVEPVAAIAPSSMPASGASSVPKDLTETATLLRSLEADPALSDLAADAAQATGSTRLKRSIAFARALVAGSSDGAKSVFAVVKADAKAASKGLSVEQTVNLAGEALSDCLVCTAGEAAYSGSVSTTDGLPLDTSTLSNFKSGSGQGSTRLVVESRGLPADSSVKSFKLEINAGGSASGSGQKLSSLSFDGAANGLVALSVDKDGVGGKVVIAFAAKGAASGIHPASATLSTYAQKASISLCVYDDSGSLVGSYSWSDIDSFKAALMSAITSSR